MASFIWPTQGSGGTTTSVGLADGSTIPIYTISGSPVTSSGTLTFTLSNKSANLVMAGPSTGSAAQPGFRALVAADLPSSYQVVGNLSDVGTDGITIGNGNNAVLGSGTTISQHVADASHNGYLSSTDWSTFNNKQPTITEGNLTEATSSVLTITGGTTAVIGSGTSIQVKQASTSVSGYLSNTDWNTFNGKQASGNYITALTGDVTASGPGSVAATLASVATAGTTGSSTAIPVVTINAKGLTTGITTAAVIAPAGTLSGTTLNSSVVTSSLTAVGTVTTGTWNATTLAIANGGTGQTSSSAAFNALSPMTTGGDIIYGGASGTGTRLANGSAGQVLTSNGTTLAPSWQAASVSITSYIWSGYHSGNSNIFTTTSATFADFSNNTNTAALNQRLNVNFGTVTGYGASSGSSALPGIVWTPPTTGYYFVKATFATNLIGANAGNLRLWDGTTVIDASQEVYGVGGETIFPTVLSGIYYAANTSSVTLSIQGAVSGGSMDIGRNDVTGQTGIEWSIWLIH